MTNSEINEAVARKLGWKEYECAPQYRAEHKAYMPVKHIMPDYAVSIAAAWELWEEMSERYFLTLETEAGEFGRNIVKIWKNDKTGAGWVIGDVYAETVPLAICQAFLKLP